MAAARIMLQRIESQLRRLSATDIRASLDDEFAPETGTLVKLKLGDAYWHLLPDHLLDVLKELPACAGSEAVREAIEKKATYVWHGPAPKGSRDTSP